MLLENLPPALLATGQARMTEYRIDRNHNNPYTEYVVDGADSRGGAYNLETARLAPLRTETVSLTGDRATLEVLLPNQSVSLLELEAVR